MEYFCKILNVIPFPNSHTQFAALLMIHRFRFAKFSFGVLKRRGNGVEGKRSRNSDRKWTRAFFGKHEQAERLSSTKRN